MNRRILGISNDELPLAEHEARSSLPTLVPSRVESLLTVREVAEMLTVPVKRVYELGIPAVRLSARSLRWRRADVRQWIEGRIRR